MISTKTECRPTSNISQIIHFKEKEINVYLKQKKDENWMKKAKQVVVVQPSSFTKNLTQHSTSWSWISVLIKQQVVRAFTCSISSFVNTYKEAANSIMPQK